MKKKNLFFAFLLVLFLFSIGGCTLMQCAAGASNNGDVNIHQDAGGDVDLDMLLVASVFLFLAVMGILLGVGLGGGGGM